MAILVLVFITSFAVVLYATPALIKVAVLKRSAVFVDENFGVARSTIEYRKRCVQ